jgi:hypothetical protein
MNFTGWHVLLHSALDPYKKHVHIMLVDQLEDADVVNRLTNLKDDQGLGAYGRAILTMDGKKSNAYRSCTSISLRETKCMNRV